MAWEGVSFFKEYHHAKNGQKTASTFTGNFLPYEIENYI